MKRSARIRRLGPFEIVKDLAAKGAQGKLYIGKALEPCFDGLAAGALVALKVMEVHDDDGERAFKRLQRRTDALVAATNPGVVRYYGCFDASDESKDQHVIVMELLQGQTLEERLEQNRLGLDADYVLRVIRICAEALVTVAEYGLVHRDIKPSNIFLCDDGGVKLIDFEIARQEGASRTTTESGAMRGTVDYMAPDFHPDFRPEKGFRGDECSDVFSLTVCLYEMLAGARPYAVGGMMGEQSMMAYFQRWTKVAGTDVTKSLKIEGYKIHALAHVQRVIKKGLSPDRSARYQTYREFWEALQNVKVREIASPEARYSLLRCVGKGGFGVVFRARRQGDGLLVAIKCLLRAEYAERFTREARTLARFHDDRLVPFVEYFSIVRNTDETHFIAMKFLDGMPGSSLRDRIATMNSRERGAEKIPFGEVLVAFRRFAGGLKTLHKGGIIHRDIKPANLYLPAGAPERACVMDLGVVKTDETQTNGSLPGTLDYMPPEMALGQSRGSPAVDIYALGLCLHEALTGQPLFPRLKRGGDGLAEFYRRAREAAPPDLARLDAFPAWQALVRDMTAHDVSRRISECSEVERRLDAIPQSEVPEPERQDEEELDDDTFAALPMKPAPRFGSEVGFRFGQSSKSIPSFEGSDEETEDIGKSAEGPKAEKPKSPVVQGKPGRPDAPGPNAKAGQGRAEDETKTAALARETAAVPAADLTKTAVADLTKTAVAKDDTVATNATFATAATKALEGGSESPPTMATSAATETNPTAKIGNKAAKPLIRVSIEQALKQAKAKARTQVAATKSPAAPVATEAAEPPAGENAEVTPKPPAPKVQPFEKPASDASNQTTKEKNQPRDSANAAAKERATTPVKPGLVITRKNHVSPMRVAFRIAVLGALVGDVVYRQKKAGKADNGPIEIPPTEPPSPSPSGPQPGGTPEPPTPAPQPTPPSPPIDDEYIRAQTLLAYEKAALAAAQRRLENTKDLTALTALDAELNARALPTQTGFDDIDKELQATGVQFKEIKQRLAEKIATRTKAEETLNAEKAALAAAQRRLKDTTGPEALTALDAELNARALPAQTGFDDIDKELQATDVQFKEIRQRLAEKIAAARKQIATRTKAEETLNAEKAALAAAQRRLKNTTGLEALNAFAKELKARTAPEPTGFANIDKELNAAATGFTKVREDLAEKIKQGEAQEYKVTKQKQKLDDAKKKINAIGSREEYQDLKSLLANNLAINPTGYPDLDEKLKAITKEFAELGQQLNAQRATLQLTNSLLETVSYSVNGIEYKVTGNGATNAALPVWTDAIPISAKVEGIAAADYASVSDTISTKGPQDQNFKSVPKYKGDPKLVISNRNAVVVSASIGGETHRIAPSATLSLHKKPRTSVPVRYSFDDDYEALGATETTIDIGDAGTTASNTVPQLTLKPRKVRIENPLPGIVSWTLSAGDGKDLVLGEEPVEISLAEGITDIGFTPRLPVAYMELKPKEKQKTKPEYNKANIDVSNVRRGSTASSVTFAPEVDSEARIDNIRMMRGPGIDYWYWTEAGTSAYDDSLNVREAECEVIENRLAIALPTNPEKTEQISEWIKGARLMARLLSARYSGIRDEGKTAKWREDFKSCKPDELKDPEGFRQELQKCLRDILK